MWTFYEGFRKQDTTEQSGFHHRVFDELRLVALDASGQTGRTGSGRAVLCITGPDSIHRLAFVAAYFGTVLG